MKTFKNKLFIKKKLLLTDISNLNYNQADGIEKSQYMSYVEQTVYYLPEIHQTFIAVYLNGSLRIQIYKIVF